MVECGINPAPGATPALEMRNISKHFGATIALDGVSFSVQRREVHAIVGENGAGKSTLMKILSGAYKPDAGEMWLFGQPYSPRHPLDGRRLGIGMIYQELSLATHLTVEENITLGVEPTRYGFLRKRQIRQIARKALAFFHHPEIQPEVRVCDLSIGARQIVEIARSLAVGCRLLVFDEPTSSLPRDDINRLFDIIRTLRDSRLAIIYISHFLEEVQQIADRVTVLRDGRAVRTYTSPHISIAALVHNMIGKRVSTLYPRSKRQPEEVILELSGLAGDRLPIRADLRLRRGEVLGICGLVGAGRTELIRAIFGLDPIRRGKIKLLSFIGPASPHLRWQQGAGILSEDRKQEGLAAGLSIAENLTLTRMPASGPLRLIMPKRLQHAAQRWIDALQIRCQNPMQNVGELSGGNQQKVALARLLHHDVDVLLLDEPTRGIDVGAKAKIYGLIDALASGKHQQRAKAILLISSYLPELLGMCDRIAVMVRGQLSPARPVDEWDEHQLMLAAVGQRAD